MGQTSPAWRQEKLIEQFRQWERCGRGEQIWRHPVALEPPFQRFPGYHLPRSEAADDGRKHTPVSGFLARMQERTKPPAIPVPPPLPRPQIEPDSQSTRDLEEIQLSLPSPRAVAASQVESFLRLICPTGEPLTFEILATDREVVPQWVVSSRPAARVRTAVETSFPGVFTSPPGASEEASISLARAWGMSGRKFAVVELGLGRECMLPLDDPGNNLLASMAATLDGIGKEELALFQIMFEPAQFPWVESMSRAVTNADGDPFFEGRTDLTQGVKSKGSSLLFAVVIRLVASAADSTRAWEIVGSMAAVLSSLARPGTNYLLPLGNQNYPAADHEDDILNRQSRRSGMLLSMSELIPLISPPTTATSRKLRRETRRTNPAPEILASGTLQLGINTHAGVRSKVFLSPEQRVRHMHVIGASGTGKSTFLLNLIKQDIEKGEGVAVLDPHGDLIDAALAFIPPERTKDVVVLDPSDDEFSVGLNILAAHSDLERNLLASDLTSVFRRLSTSWGDQMESVLRNAIMAFLESSRGGTLVDLRRFLLEPAFRNEFLASVNDSEVVYYWTKAFPLLSGGKSIGPVLTRLDEFLSRKPLRYMVAQKDSPLDFGALLDGGGILLAKLPQGLIGRENTVLLGSLIISKLQMAVMSRQRMPAAQRRDFWCYLDEAQNFFTPSMAEILAGARKYRFGLILAHQELRHLDADRDVASAALSNCLTRVVFKVGDADAHSLERGFSHFEAHDLMNLGTGETICRVERSDFDFNLSTSPLSPIDEEDEARVREQVIAFSRATYARPRSEIEAELLRSMQEKGKPRPDVQRRNAPAGPAISETQTPRSPSPAVDRGAETQANPATPPGEEPASAIPRTPSAFGRGGPEHRAIQQDIKDCAEKLGFHVVIEKAVLGGAGFVDVSLESDDQKIACEISVTTQADYETANFRKCLAGGYEAVIAIATHKDRLVEMAAAIRTHLGNEEAKRIHLSLPSRFPALLKRLARQNRSGSPPDSRSGGYKIKRKYSDDPHDVQAQVTEEEFLRVIGRLLRHEEA